MGAYAAPPGSATHLLGHLIGTCGSGGGTRPKPSFERPALILMDIQLARLGGWEATRQINVARAKGRGTRAGSRSQWYYSKRTIA
jgi:CheY-like chemotaxis protein